MFRNRTIVEELQDTFSDFHKDVHGFRPRFATDEQWVSAEWLQEQIDDLHRYLENCKSTFEGRERLREDGWEVKETDPQLAAIAHMNKEAREKARREEDEWYYQQSMAYHLEQERKEREQIELNAAYPQLAEQVETAKGWL